MGFGAAFDYSGPAAIFREHAALSTFENNGTRDFNLGGLAAFSDADYHALTPLQWPVPEGSLGGEKRMFSDGRFFTPSERARLIAIEEPVLAEPPDADFPFLLNTGRVRDQWHTMTRTGLSPKLASHMPDPFVEMNPDDAGQLGLAADGFAKVSTAHGSAVLRVNITAAQVHGRIFVPIHWNDATSARARIGALAGHLGGDRRWRMFDRCDWEVPKRRDELRFVSARSEENDRGGPFAYSQSSPTWALQLNAPSNAKRHQSGGEPASRRPCARCIAQARSL
jgi:anaerobic selenocysteine-containing dehydrogenase